jgi:hypothetical protein
VGGEELEWAGARAAKATAVEHEKVGEAVVVVVQWVVSTVSTVPGDGTPLTEAHEGDGWAVS